MTFQIHHSATILHTRPHTAGGTILLGNLVGEVLLAHGSRQERFYFDRVTFAPFKEALFSAIAQLSDSEPTGVAGRRATWIASADWEEAREVFSSLVCKSVQECFQQRDALPAVVMECSARCVHPWGSVDLVRNEEITGPTGAKWSVFGRTPINSDQSVHTIVDTALRYYAAREFRTDAALLQLQWAVQDGHTGTAVTSHCFTLTTDVITLCECFAVDDGSLHNALIRDGKGRWVDNPLLKFLLPSSSSGIDQFIMISCIGRDTADDTAAVCRFAGRDAPHSRMPSPLSICKAERSNISVLRNGSEGGPRHAATALFAGPSRETSEQYSATPLENPMASPSRPLLWEHTPLTYFGNFGKALHPESPSLPSPTATPTQPTVSLQDAASTGSALRLNGALKPSGDTSAALRRVEDELERHVREREARAAEALRAAEERMTRARSLGRAARDLARRSEGDISAIHSRHQHALTEVRHQLAPLHHQRETDEAHLTSLSNQIHVTTIEAAALDDRVMKARDNLQYAESQFSEARRTAQHRDAQIRRDLEQAGSLWARALQHASSLYCISLTAHEQVFSEASETVHDHARRELEARERALQRINSQLEQATVQLMEDCKAVASSKASLEDTRRKSQQETEALSAEVTRMHEQQRGVVDQIAAQSARLDELRADIDFEQERSSDKQRADQAAHRRRHIEALASDEHVARQNITVKWAQNAMRSFSTFIATAHFSVPPAVPSVSDGSSEDGETLGKLSNEIEDALTEIQGLSELKKMLEADLGQVMADLEEAVSVVIESETTMMRESRRSLDLLHVCESQSTAEFSALIDRCTALVDARSSSRRSSMASVPSTPSNIFQ